MLTLNDANYYSQAANMNYMSVSQYKDFAGSYGRLGCEEMAMAKLNGKYNPAPNKAMLIGSYIDSYFEGPDSFDRFRNSHQEIYTQTGDLRKDYQQAESIIKRIQRDSYFMNCMSGEKQTIMTGHLFGTDWKIKMDSYIPGKVIVDLKIIKSIKKKEYVRDIGFLDFIRYWGYDIQAAIYQEVVYQNTGYRLPFYIAAASKEPVTDIAVIHVTDNFLQEALQNVEYHMPRILQVKSGEVIPDRCEVCEYCLDTKCLSGPIGLFDLVDAV